MYYIALHALAVQHVYQQEYGSKIFKLTKSQKRILNKNSNLFRGYHSALATDEQYELFNKYLNTRHSNGGMSEMTVFEYSSMLEDDTNKYKKLLNTIQKHKMEDIHLIV